MASQTEKEEIERLEEDNRVFLERLTGLENELARRDKTLQDSLDQKERACKELKESQRKLEDLRHQLEEAEDAEIRAKGREREREKPFIQRPIWIPAITPALIKSS